MWKCITHMISVTTACLFTLCQCFSSVACSYFCESVCLLATDVIQGFVLWTCKVWLTWHGLQTRIISAPQTHTFPLEWSQANQNQIDRGNDCPEGCQTGFFKTIERVFLYYLGLSVVVILFNKSSGFVLLLLWYWVCIGKACMCSLEMKLACLNLKAVCTSVVLGSLKFDCLRSLVPLKGCLTLKVTSYTIRHQDG